MIEPGRYGLVDTHVHLRYAPESRGGGFFVFFVFCGARVRRCPCYLLSTCFCSRASTLPSSCSFITRTSRTLVPVVRAEYPPHLLTSPSTSVAPSEPPWSSRSCRLATTRLVDLIRIRRAPESSRRRGGSPLCASTKARAQTIRPSTSLCQFRHPAARAVWRAWDASHRLQSTASATCNERAASLATATAVGFNSFPDRPPPCSRTRT